MPKYKQATLEALNVPLTEFIKTCALLVANHEIKTIDDFRICVGSALTATIELIGEFLNDRGDFLEDILRSLVCNLEKSGWNQDQIVESVKLSLQEHPTVAIKKNEFRARQEGLC